jgi:ABC-type uncharacterized transport system involved in gliding motility auxiliary subunit
MNDTPASAPSSLKPAWDAALERVSRLSGRTLAWGGLALAAVILLSVNLISSLALKGWKADLTEERLFTISDGTRSILRSIDEPIKARVYFSKKLGEVAPSYARYFDRVRTLLEQYRDISGGKLELEFLDPEPFSDAEDRAVAAGLRGIRINAEGETGYFGLAATNATDNQETIHFFSPDRESFVEYDITKLVHALSNPRKRVVGLITGLPLDGGTSPFGNQPTPPWLIMDQMREFFEVQTIDQAAKEIPARVDVLLVAQPTGLTPAAAYAIDQYALKGGKVLALIDPLPEAAHLAMMGQSGEGRAELAKLLKTWGVDFEPGKVAADIGYARRVQFGGRGGDGMVTEYVAWLGLDRTAIDQHDVLSNGIEVLNLASAGFLSKVEGAGTEVTPILHTSGDAMEVAAQKTGMGADPVGLLRAYKPGGKSLMLAARISGEAKSAFPDGPPKDEEKKADDKKAGDKKTDEKSTEDKKDDNKPGDTPPAESGAAKTAESKPAPPASHVASGRINAVVVADTDLLADQFWVETREMLGQQVVMPNAHNAAFVVGALENLTGSDALIALRGRGVKERRFTLVESLRRDSEREFREKEQALTEKLRNVEQELKKLEATGEGGTVILSDTERQSIERFRGEMLATRRELRNVKLALRHDIDSLDGWLKFANIALIPAFLGLGGLGWSIWQSRRGKTSP